MEKLLIIADDFTGALDTGIQFAAYGARTEIMTDTDMEFGDYPSAEVLLWIRKPDICRGRKLMMWFTGLHEKRGRQELHICTKKQIPV